MMRRRVGRPGLIGTMARTTVIAGTATAVSGSVARRQQQQAMEQAPPPAASVAPIAPTAPAETDDLMSKLERLADLKANGMLDDAEYAAAKARLLA
jgi:hypothetical protein